MEDDDESKVVEDEKQAPPSSSMQVMDDADVETAKVVNAGHAIDSITAPSAHDDTAQQLHHQQQDQDNDDEDEDDESDEGNRIEAQDDSSSDDEEEENNQMMGDDAPSVVPSEGAVEPAGETTITSTQALPPLSSTSSSSLEVGELDQTTPFSVFSCTAPSPLQRLASYVNLPPFAGPPPLATDNLYADGDDLRLQVLRVFMVKEMTRRGGIPQAQILDECDLNTGTSGREGG